MQSIDRQAMVLAVATLRGELLVIKMDLSEAIQEIKKEIKNELRKDIQEIKNELRDNVMKKKKEKSNVSS